MAPKKRTLRASQGIAMTYSSPYAFHICRLCLLFPRVLHMSCFSFGVFGSCVVKAPPPVDDAVDDDAVDDGVADFFQDKMPYELPSEWVDASAKRSRSSSVHRVDFSVFLRRRIHGRAHPSLGRCLAVMDRWITDDHGNIFWLVVWLPFFIFPDIGILIIPID